jgi:hypothetical protein
MIFLFGAREHESRDAPESDIARFLCGHDVELTPGLACQLLHEFAAQERYRQRLISSLQRVVAALRAKSVACAQALEHPPTTIDEAILGGVGLGQYRAYAESTGAIVDALQGIAAEIE